MALVPYTITAIELNTADAVTSGKQVVVGASCSMYLQPADTIVTLYNDSSGGTGSTAKTTDANGQVTVYLQKGEYRLVTNGISRYVQAGDAVNSTTTALIASTMVYEVGDVVVTDGYTTKGDGGGGSWLLTATTGTASQSPAQLGDALLNDASGNQWALVTNGTINAESLGAVGDGATDDTAAIHAAVKTGHTIKFSAKQYMVTNLIIDKPGVTLKGSSTPSTAGQRGTEIRSETETGAIIRLKERYCAVKGIFLDATGARLAATNTTGYGIHVEADDVVGERAMWSNLNSVEIRNQPSHGVLYIAGSSWFASLKQVWVFNCRGHGIIYDYGTLVGRTNKEAVGLSHLDMCTSQENAGQGLVIGNDDAGGNRGFRMTVTNCDFSVNADSVGIRRGAYQVWAFTGSSSFNNCVFGGADLARTVANTGGIRIAGVATNITNSRGLNITNELVHIHEVAGKITTGINVDEWLLVGDFQLSLPISVLIDIGIEKCRAYSSDNTFIEKIVNFSAQTRNFHRTEIVTKLNQDERNQITTNTADSELFFRMRVEEKAQFKAVIFYQSSATANIKMTFTAPPGNTIKWGPSSGLIVNTSGVVVPQDTKTVSGSSMIMGVADGLIKSIELVGEVVTSGNAGDVVFSFSQASSDNFDTAVTAQSYITVYRM